MMRSSTSLHRTNNGTFPYEYNVNCKHLKILMCDMCNSPPMNNLKTEKKIIEIKKDMQKIISDC